MIILCVVLLITDTLHKEGEAKIEMMEEINEKSVQFFGNSIHLFEQIEHTLYKAWMYMGKSLVFRYKLLVLFFRTALIASVQPFGSEGRENAS